MAVVSLSRIQIRRGRKYQDGIPQLASGELAWAIDSQELYIGNGSLAEGAPAVGNTKILTEHDNIFDLTESYYYKKDLPNTYGRSLQDRLDDYVSIRAFVDPANLDEDHSDFLQNAINQLFRQDLQPTTQAMTLYIEPGTYNISKPILLPPRTQIQGAGAGRTVFKISDNPLNPFTEVFKTDTEQYTGPNNNIQFLYPQNISVKDLTVDLFSSNDTVKSVFVLTGCTHSKFVNLDIIGNTDTLIHTGFQINNAVFGDDFVTAKNNIIENVYFNHLNNAIYSQSDIQHNTARDCIFENIILPVMLDDTQSYELTGPVGNIVENCWFDAITQNAIKIVKGSGNVSQNNKFNNVGNIVTNGDFIPYYPVIEFLSAGNASNGDWFLRTYDLMNTENVPYVPEVKGISVYENKFRHQRVIGEYDQPARIINLSVSGYQTIEVQYKYKSNQYDAFRTGTLKINANSITGEVSINDEYDYVGDSLYLDNISFITQSYNNGGSFQYAIDTLGILMLNSTNNDSADFYYSVKYIN